MTAKFGNFAAPINEAIAVVPANGTAVGNGADGFRCLYVGVSGDVAVTMAVGKNVVVFPGLPVGWHPINGVTVEATGTTASGIIAGW